jgi:hypothetical protein
MPARPIVQRPLPASAPVISHIALELAREPGHPYGDRHHAYHLYLPLKAGGEIDAESLGRASAQCRVRRIRPGEPELRGRILHGPGGQWTFDYADRPASDNETGFRLEHERFVRGEYVSIRQDNGLHTFQVVSIRPL